MSIGGIVLLNLCLIVVLILMFHGLKNIISATLFDFSFLYKVFILVVAPLIFFIVNIIIYFISNNVVSIIIVDILIKYLIFILLKYYIKIKRIEATQHKFQDSIKKVVFQKFEEYGILLSEDNIGVLIRNNKSHLYCKVIIRLDTRSIDEYILIRVNENLEKSVKAIDDRIRLDLDIKD